MSWIVLGLIAGIVASVYIEPELLGIIFQILVLGALVIACVIIVSLIVTGPFLLSGGLFHLVWNFGLVPAFGLNTIRFGTSVILGSIILLSVKILTK